jgi:hypothetical protein
VTAGPISSDVVALISKSTSALVVSTGATPATVTVRGRTAQGYALRGLTFTCASTSPTVASGAFVGDVLTVTFGAAGSATLTITEQASGTTTTIAVAVSSAQLFEDFATNSIRPTIWTVTATGTGAASAATGKLRLTTTSAGPGNVEVTNPGTSGNRYSARTAGALASGVVAKPESVATPGNGYWVIQDATGVGYGFHVSGGPGGSIEFGRLAAGAGIIDSRYNSSSQITYDAVAHLYWRFLYDPTADELALQTSPTGLAGSWTTRSSLSNAAGPTSMDLDHWGEGYAVKSGSSDNEMVVALTVVN